MACFTKFLLILFIISAIPIAWLISVERAKATTHMYQFQSVGWLRECTKWDDVNHRFIISFGEGGLGQIPVPRNHSTSSVLEEIPIVKDVDQGRNASIGITIDRPRNRILVAIGDAFGSRYSGLAAYELNTWKRLFLTHLSASGMFVFHLNIMSEYIIRHHLRKQTTYIYIYIFTPLKSECI